MCAVVAGRASGTEETNGFCMVAECFAVFQAADTFTAAQRQCGDLGGNLMTVRSNVSHDILSVVLGNLTGRFWLGLHRTVDCPVASAQLKGFLWETGDSESDFSNWAQSFDSSCSSHRCVSVSPDDDFQWIQEPCDERAEGFFCEYTFSQSCKGLQVPAGESVTYTTHLGFEGNDLQYLPPGTTAVRMRDGSKYICSAENWLQAPWSCEILKGGCEYKCTEDPKSVPSCYCPPGHTVNLINQVTCEVDQVDPCAALRCAHACVPDGASYTCRCDTGFELAADGRSCVDFDDCTDERQCPGENSECINTIGGFQCVCKPGYKVTGDLCVDMDECASAPCEHLCANTAGSYKCSCHEGFKEDPTSPEKCKLHCKENECPAECDPNDMFQCYCPDGYIAEERPSGTVCIDINECFSSFCDHKCENTLGSYVCACSPGYTLVQQHECVKNGVENDTDGGTEGSAEPTVPSTLTASPTPHAEPTRQPDAVTVGTLTAIIVCTVLFIVLVVFLARHVFSGVGKMKTPGNEAHSLRSVTSDA